MKFFFVDEVGISIERTTKEMEKKTYLNVWIKYLE